MDCEEAIVEGFFCVQCWILVLVRVSRLSRFRAKMRWCCSVPFSFLFGVRERKFEIYKRERERERVKWGRKKSDEIPCLGVWSISV